MTAKQMRPVPVWRSLLFVPAHVERFVRQAHTRGADCIQLDIEDSVPLEAKPAARAAIRAAAATVRRGGADVLVRINAPLALAVPDIIAAVGPHVDGIVIAKARGPEHLWLIDELVAACERDAGVEHGRTWLLPMIEDPAALPLAAAIARASPRVVAMSLGPEDFATAIGAEPTEEALLVANQLLLHAARAAGVLPLGLLGTLAGFADLAAFRDLARRSRRAGFEGASCINPAQVAPLNEAFTPGAEEMLYARRVVEAATGHGAVALEGRMIDEPVVRRAERLLARAEAIRARELAARG